MAEKKTKITEIHEHLQILAKEVTHLRQAAQNEIEDNWLKLPETTGSAFDNWSKQMAPLWCAGFALSKHQWVMATQFSRPHAGPFEKYPQQNAADQSAPRGKRWLGLQEHLDQQGFHQTAHHIGLVQGSQDLEICFAENTLCLPIIPINSIRGILIAQVKMDTNHVAAYQKISHACEVFLQEIREQLLHGIESSLLGAVS